MAKLKPLPKGVLPDQPQWLVNLRESERQELEECILEEDPDLKDAAIFTLQRFFPGLCFDRDYVHIASAMQALRCPECLTRWKTECLPHQEADPEGARIERACRDLVEMLPDRVRAIQKSYEQWQTGDEALLGWIVEREREAGRATLARLELLYELARQELSNSAWDRLVSPTSGNRNSWWHNIARRLATEVETALKSQGSAPPTRGSETLANVVAELMNKAVRKRDAFESGTVRKALQKAQR